MFSFVFERGKFKSVARIEVFPQNLNFTLFSNFSCHIRRYKTSTKKIFLKNFVENLTIISFYVQLMLKAK